MRAAARGFAALMALAALAGCAGGSDEAANPALLRMEYLERAPRLPHLRVDGVEMQTSSRLGRGSSLVWRHHDESAETEYNRPLPQPEPGDIVHESLVEVFESFGFATHGWPEHPEVLLRVRVEKLVLDSRGEEEGSRACELELAFTAREAPSGLEIARFKARGRAELPGSWTRVRGGEPRWVPVPDQADPLREAAVAVAMGFLQDSSKFWSHPPNWEPSVRLPGRF